MIRRRRQLLLALLVGTTVLVTYFFVRQMANADEFVTNTQTTLNQFNPGLFERTGLATLGNPDIPDSGAVSLIALGVAGDWITNTGTNLPPMFGQGTVEHNWYIYTIGGHLSGSVTINNVYYARIITTTLPHSLALFSTTTPLPLDIYPDGLYLHATAVVSDYVYVIGGEDSANSVYGDVIFSQFNPTTGELGPWQTTASLPQPRLAAGVAVVSDTIYIIGGQDTSFGSQNTVYYATPGGDGNITQWHTATDSLPQTMYANMGAANGPFLYSMGGYNTNSTSGNFRYEVFYATPLITGDIASDGWITTVNLLNPVFRGAGLGVNGVLFATGGNRGGFDPADVVEASFLEDDGSVRFWADSQNLQPSRMAHGIVADRDKFLYIIGGANASGAVPVDTGVINIGRTAGQGAKAYAPSGRYTSPPIQLGNVNRILDKLHWSSWQPTDQVTMAMRYRYQEAGKAWSQWLGPFLSNRGTGIQTTTVMLTSTARFFQYQASFNTAWVTSAITTPFLLQVDIDYIIPSPPEMIKRAIPPDQLTSGAPGLVAPGDLISYTIALTSTSSRGLPGSLITDILPVGTSFVAGTQYVSATFPITSSVVGNAIAWDVGTFPAGVQTRVVLGYAARVNGDVRAGQYLTNTVIFRSDVNEPVLNFTRHVVNAPIGLVKQQTSSAPPGSTETVETGDRITYTVVVSNPNSAALTNVIITDTAPADTSYVVGSVALTPPLSGTVDQSQRPLLRWDVSVLGVGDAVTARFSVIVTTTVRDRVIANQATASTDQSFPRVSNSVSYIVVVPAELRKSADPPSGFLVARGDLITYTLSFSNPNSALLTNVVIGDRVPANTTFVSCTDNCGLVGEALTWSKTVGVRQAGSVRFTVRVNSTAPYGTAIVNEATLGSHQQHGLSQSNSTTHTVQSVGAGEISKTADPPGGLDLARSVLPGAWITYTLRYTNSHPSASLTGVVVNDPLPANTSFVSCSDGCLFNAGAASWSLGSLAPGASGQVRLTVQVVSSAPDNAIIQNQASMSSTQGQVASESIVHRVVIPYDLQLSMTNNMTATPPGSTFTYTLVYTNQGPFPLNGVVVTDYLAYVPAGQASGSPMPYVSFVPGRSPCWKLDDLSVEGSTYTCTLGTLSPGQTGTLIMGIQLDSNIPYNVNLMNNHAVIADDGTHLRDTNPSNQVADVSTPIQGSDLTISNPHIVGGSKPGELFTVTATIVNRGLTGTVTWERVITPDNPGNNWFAVEVYLRPVAWQSGPPSGPHDHAGGYCSGQTTPCDPAEQRFRYLRFVSYSNGLVPYYPIEVSFPVSVTTVGAYLVYMQVDNGFWFFNDPPYGRILEFDELDNVALVGVVGLGKQVFLPIIFRR